MTYQDQATTQPTAALPLPPGEFGWPLIGETLEFARSPGAFGDRRRDRYGPVLPHPYSGQQNRVLARRRS